MYNASPQNLCNSGPEFLPEIQATPSTPAVLIESRLKQYHQIIFARADNESQQNGI